MIIKILIINQKIIKIVKLKNFLNKKHNDPDKKKQKKKKNIKIK